MTILQTMVDITDSKDIVIYATVATSHINVITIVVDKDQEYASGRQLSNAMKDHKSGDKSAVLWTTNDSFSLVDMIGSTDAEMLLMMYMIEVADNEN